MKGAHRVLGSVLHPIWAGKKASASICSGIFNRTYWLLKEPCGGIQSPTSPWAHLSALYFSFQGEFLFFFPVKKEVTPQQLALRLEPVLSRYVWPHLLGLLRKTRALSRVLLFLSSHTAFICHIMKYKGVCCNLFCQSRQGSKLSQAFSHLVNLSVSKGLEKVIPSRFQMSRLSSASCFSHIWCSVCFCGQHHAKEILTTWKLSWEWVTRGWMVQLLSHEEWLRDCEYFE